MYHILKDAVKHDNAQLTHDKQFLNTLIKSTMSEELLTNCLMDYAFIYKGHRLFEAYGWQGGAIHQVVDETIARQKSQSILV